MSQSVLYADVFCACTHPTHRHTCVHTHTHTHTYTHTHTCAHTYIRSCLTASSRKALTNIRFQHNLKKYLQKCKMTENKNIMHIIML